MARGSVADFIANVKKRIAFYLTNSNVYFIFDRYHDRTCWTMMTFASSWYVSRSVRMNRSLFFTSMGQASSKGIQNTSVLVFWIPWSSLLRQICVSMWTVDGIVCPVSTLKKWSWPELCFLFSTGCKTTFLAGSFRLDGIDFYLTNNNVYFIFDRYHDYSI